MWEDPIVAEVRRIRGELAAKFDFDVHAIFADMRHRQAALGDKLVRDRNAESVDPADLGDGERPPEGEVDFRPQRRGGSMTSEEVRALVEREIGDDWLRTNWHGCDLRCCLVTPELQDYEDWRTPPSVVRLWRVLEEGAEDRSGYKIVFDEQSGLFGLAIPGVSRDVVIGWYGTFLETYDGM